MLENGISGFSRVPIVSGILDTDPKPKYAYICMSTIVKDEFATQMNMETLTGFKIPLTNVACVCCSFLLGIEIGGVNLMSDSSSGVAITVTLQL